MPIQLHAKYTGEGVTLSRIALHEDAESLCHFFQERGIAATMAPLSSPGDCRVFLIGLTLEHFATLIDGANVELV